MEGGCERTLRKLAPELGDDWEKLASFLGFSRCQICMFKRDNPLRTEEQAFAMLVKWRQSSCCGDKMQKLCKELREIGRKELADRLQTQKEECSIHRGEMTTYFCRTCNYRICRFCIVVDHRDHCYIDIIEDFQSFKQESKDILAALHNDIEKLKKMLDEISEDKKILEDKLAQAITDINDNGAKVIAAVTAKIKAAQNQKIAQIEVSQRDRNATFDKHEREVREQLRQKQRVMDMAKDLAHKEADPAYLSLIPTIRSELMCAQSQCPPTLTCKRSFPKFMPSLKPYDMDLGRLVLEDMWKLSTEFGRKGKGLGEFEAAKGIAAAAPDEIAVTDWENERVTTSTSKGKPKSSIPTKACDIAASTCRWVLADRHTVKVYDNDKKLVSDLPTLPESENRATDVQLDSVAIKSNSNIIAGDVKRNVVTELDPDGTIVNTIPVRTTPEFLAAMNNDRIAVSSWEQGLVDVVDGNASTIFTIKPTIKGQPAKHCSGVCYDSSAGIYLAVSTGHFKGGHIHHYDSEGNFISCIARGLHNPMGITFTADGQQLAVADWHSVKIYHKV